MNALACLREFETQLGVELPTDYREFLATHSHTVLDPELVFEMPAGSSGILTYLLTACDLLDASNRGQIGDPDRAMMSIGSDMMGGHVYMCVSDSAFGWIYYRVLYRANDYVEVAQSFSGLMALCRPLADELDA